jgi:glycosyltransferase involved in cell wall biosynthesis
MPRVSVVIPAYNAAPLIGAALTSVFSQTFVDLECIVVDDGSKDEAQLREALRPWGDRILHVRQENGGPAKARNTGIALATGELIAFLDADDEWLPDKLAKQVAYFDRYPTTGLLHTGMVGERESLRPAGGPPRNAFCDLFHTRFFVNTLTVMIPAAVLKDVGGFDERREIHIEDWDLWLRIAARYSFGYLPDALAIHRPGGFMSTQVERTYASQLLVSDKNAGLCAQACEKHRAAPAACMRERRHVLHRDWGYDRLQAGDHRGAREQFGQALACSPADLRTGALYAATFLPAAVLGRRRAASTASVTSAASARRPALSLVHDTTYRRLRRRVISRLHDVDDALFATRSGRKRILFDAASPMSFAILRPLYDRVRRDPRLELWFTAHGKVWSPEQIYNPIGIRENIVTSGVAAGMKVHLYVNTDFWDMTWLHRRARRMHLFHGVAGKYHLDAPMDLAPTIATFDSLLFVNRDRRDRYIEAQLVPDDPVKAALVGYPKVDCLLNGSLDAEQIRGHLGFSAAVPTVIYAPTWSPHSSLTEMGEPLVERLAAAGLQVIVKLHDRSYDTGQRGSGGIDWAERLRRFETHPRVRVVREADSSPYLFVSDAMVSDHSSIAFEFMLLDRPLVVIDRPGLIQHAGINQDKVRRLRSAAAVADSVDSTVTAVLEALRDPAALSAQRQAVSAELFYRPGTATDRAVALLYHLVNLPELADQRAVADTGAVMAAIG